MSNKRDPEVVPTSYRETRTVRKKKEGKPHERKPWSHCVHAGRAPRKLRTPERKTKKKTPGGSLNKTSRKITREWRESDAWWYLNSRTTKEIDPGGREKVVQERKIVVGHKQGR